jgi:hypothetical protein
VVEKMKSYKLPSSDQILAELIQAGGEILQSEIHKLINSVWNKEVLREQFKESIIVPIYRKDHETDCSNYQAVSVLLMSHKMLCNSLPSRLSPYVGKPVGDRQCGF